MPTNRKRVSRQGRRDAIDPAVHAFFTGQPLPPGANAFRYFVAEHPGLWAQYREEILSSWVADHPGTRPPAWWLYDAPEQRQRLGGKGTPWNDTDPQRSSILGIPGHWVADIFIDTEHPDIEFIAEHFDPIDPPIFESQAAFLKRLKLLMPGESRRLKADAFEPEILPAELWPG